MTDEDAPDPLANLDQALAGLATRARIFRSYFTALIEEGFDEEQALALTRDYAAKWGLG